MRHLLAVSWLAFALPLFGQMEGKFSLAKETYLIGEPVMLVFEMRNTGKNPLTVPSADPHSFCSGFEITVTGGEPPGQISGPSTCNKVLGGSCLSGSQS